MSSADGFAPHRIGRARGDLGLEDQEMTPDIGRSRGCYSGGGDGVGGVAVGEQLAQHTFVDIGLEEGQRAVMPGAGRRAGGRGKPPGGERVGEM